MKMGLAYFLDKTRYFALLSRKSNEKTTWDVGRTFEEFVNHSPAARDFGILLVFYQYPVWFISL